jgi:Zn-dependent M28 family amino/carboxypeptidase
MRHRSTRIAALAILAAIAATLAALAVPAAATSASPVCLIRTNDTYKEVLDCVTVAGVRVHQGAFQLIANRNDDEFYPGTRAAGTEGYRNSALYIAGLLRLAGYRVTLDPFEFEFVGTLVTQTAPTTARHSSAPFTGSAEGTVTDTAVVPVDINLEPPRASDSGCSTDETTGAPENDFVGFPAGAIALVQRGTCTFAEKVVNAQAAGASGAIIFNQGNTPEREGVVTGTLIPSTAPITVPVVGVSFASGAVLSEDGTRATVRVLIETRTDHNVIAELRGENDGNVVMAGAHLDSETLGPGINDNASGSAALLETALVLRRLKPENTIRFAWWGAEESGLLGSAAYVEGLSEAERDRIALYMNYDMVGSPNYVFMVYDADESTFPAPEGVPIPPGSTAIEDFYESYYTLVGEPYDDTEFSGRSDYQAFIEAGIPSGGLFTGAEEIKTAEQQSIWGGTVGAQFDPCYHIACDTFGNVSLKALGVNSDLIAVAQLTFAYSTESVNQVPGEAVPGPPLNLPPPAGPRGTFEP